MEKQLFLTRQAATFARKRRLVLDVTTLRSRLRQISDARDTLYIIGQELNALKLEVEVFSVILADAFESVLVPETVPAHIRAIAEQMGEHSAYPPGRYIRETRV